MERWSGRVAVVTGASAGIGAAIALELAKKGMLVAGLARRADKVQELNALLDGAQGQLHAVPCDLTNEKDILAAFEWVNSNLGGIDVLVNNAGVLHLEPLSSGNHQNWRNLLEVNVLALSICTREAIKAMNNRKIDGHIIHINSVAGHYQTRVSKASMYCATKHAVTALTEGLRLELVNSGSKIKVTSVSPGFVLTDMTTRFGDINGLQPKDVANSVVFALSTPPHVQIQELMLRAVPETLPKTEGAQPDFPLEYQRGGSPEKPPETRESPPEKPQDHEPEQQPEIQPELLTETLSEILPEQRELPPENQPESQQESQPENPAEPTPENPPENSTEPTIDEGTAENPPEKPEAKQPESPPESSPEKPASEEPQPEP